MLNRPIFCFEAFHTRDAVMENLGYHVSHDDVRMDVGRRIRVDKWIHKNGDMAGGPLYVSTIRVRSSFEYLQDLEFIKENFPAFFVFHNTVDTQLFNQLGPKFALNASPHVLERVCGLILTDEQKSVHTTLIQPTRPTQDGRQPSIFNDGFADALYRDYFQGDGDLETIFNPNPEHEQIQQALELSRREYERMDVLRDQTRIRLQNGWEKVLKKSDPKKRGYPVCICCLNARASICTVDCGCVVLCDDCVREIWTRTNLKRVCPSCQQECSMISRVRFSELAESDGEENEDAPKKKLKK